MGQQGSYNEYAQIDAAGLFADDHKHLIGQTLGQSGLGEYEPDHYGCKDKQDGGVHEIFEGHLGRADEKHGLQYADGQGGYADGYNFKYPPCACQQKYADSTFSLFT